MPDPFITPSIVSASVVPLSVVSASVVPLSVVPPSVVAYLALLAAVGGGRLIEMRLSRRHQRSLSARGFVREREPAFPVMVAVHTGVLLGAAIEVLVTRRPVNSVLAVTALVAFILANALRWWVIHTMAEHWNVQVVNALRLGVVTAGPFRWVRHPNYVAVFVELLALPLIHAAYVTAVVGTAAHLVILARRISFEERILLADAGYCATMGTKPRFVPWSRSPIPGSPVHFVGSSRSPSHAPTAPAATKVSVEKH